MARRMSKAKLAEKKKRIKRQQKNARNNKRDRIKALIMKKFVWPPVNKWGKITDHVLTSNKGLAEVDYADIEARTIASFHRGGVAIAAGIDKMVMQNYMYGDFDVEDCIAIDQEIKQNHFDLMHRSWPELTRRAY